MRGRAARPATAPRNLIPPKPSWMSPVALMEGTTISHIPQAPLKLVPYKPIREPRKALRSGRCISPAFGVPCCWIKVLELRSNVTQTSSWRAHIEHAPRPTSRAPNHRHAMYTSGCFMLLRGSLTARAPILVREVQKKPHALTNLDRAFQQHRDTVQRMAAAQCVINATTVPCKNYRQSMREHLLKVQLLSPPGCHLRALRRGRLRCRRHRLLAFTLEAGHTAHGAFSAQKAENRGRACVRDVGFLPRQPRGTAWGSNIQALPQLNA